MTKLGVVSGDNLIKIAVDEDVLIGISFLPLSIDKLNKGGKRQFDCNLSLSLMSGLHS